MCIHIDRLRPPWKECRVRLPLERPLHRPLDLQRSESPSRILRLAVSVSVSLSVSSPLSLSVSLSVSLSLSLSLSLCLSVSLSLCLSVSLSLCLSQSQSLNLSISQSQISMRQCERAGAQESDSESESVHVCIHMFSRTNIHAQEHTRREPT